MTRYEALVNEKDELWASLGTLKWVARILRGDPVGGETVAIGVLQSRNTHHIGMSGRLTSRHAATILLVVEDTISYSEGRIAEINKILHGVEASIAQLVSARETHK